MMGARESGWRSVVKGWPAFVVVLAVVAVAAVQVVDFSTRRRGATEDDVAKLRRSVEALAADVREVRGMLEGIGAGEGAVRTGEGLPGVTGADLPAPGEGASAEGRTVVSVHADGTYVIDGTPCSADELDTALDALAKTHPEREVLVVAKDASYEAVVGLIERCEERGLKIAGAAGSSEVGTGEAAEAVEINLDPVDVLLEIDAARTCALDGRDVARDALAAELKKVLAANPAMRLVVRAHEAVPTSEVEKIIAIAGEAGIHRVDIGGTAGEETPDSGE
jgi:biopolymer transport protein ExbD